ncbi:MAG TPA: ABC transporter permease [Vicinamibacterales bacterium]|nr:ABC transporter permease [Vicinamibacterales bacterium]
MAHLRLALRTLFRTPFITLVAIVSLALGIGANAAIFSLFDQMLLRKLPVQAPDELVNLANPGPKPGSQTCNNQGGCDEVFSYAMVRDLQQAPQTRELFTGIAAHRTFGANLAYRGQTINGSGMMVSGNYFPLLGIQPALGRLLTDRDDETMGGHPVAVLSEEYWRTRFDSNPDVVNETLIVNGQPLTIVGVAPPDFHGTSLGSRPHIYVPVTMRGALQPGFVREGSNGFENRRAYWAYLFGRLKPGVSIEQAATGISVPYAAILNDVEAPLQQGMSEQTMARFKEKKIALAPGYRGQSSLHEEASTPLILLLSVTGVVLLIACANIANLLLVRGAGRAGEMAVRLSIGANRRQLVGQLLLESLVLAVIGAVVGVLVSRWTLDLIGSLLPAQAAATIDFRIDRTVILFSGVLALGTGLLFGLFPALHSTRPSLVTALREDAGQKGAARGASRFRLTLATVQIALSMALLVAAGLFVKSLINVSRVDLGVQTDNLIAFAISPSLNGYTPERTRGLFERVEDELAALPGVTSVSASLVPLLAGNNWGSSVSVQGFEAGPDTDTHSNYNEVGPGYFQTVGIPLLAGRDFTRADALGAGKVAIVNEAFAKKFGLGRDAVGKYMSDSTGNAVKLDMQIVGLVQDAKYSEVKQAPPPLFFRPYRQNERPGFSGFYVKTAMDPEQLMPSIHSAIAKLDPNLPVEDLKTVEQQVRENVFLDRMISTLSAAFAVLATILAAVGLYGVLAYTVAQRTREIGVRMALGADGGDVRRMVLRQVGIMTLIGAVIGLAGAFALGRGAESLLFEMQGNDPIVFAAATMLLALVALGAGFVPAQKAARTDPMIALRYE